MQPPQEINEAAGIGLSARLEAVGRAAHEARTASAYDRLVASGESEFRPAGDAERLADVVKFRWKMVSTKGEPGGRGLDFLVLGPDGRIRRDYPFE